MQHNMLRYSSRLLRVLSFAVNFNWPGKVIMLTDRDMIGCFVFVYTCNIPQIPKLSLSRILFQILTCEDNLISCVGS
jgi:hypothetical protein